MLWRSLCRLYSFHFPKKKKKKKRKLLNEVFRWANKNEMTFGVNKCATMVIEPLHYVSPFFLLNLLSILVCTLFLKHFHIYKLGNSIY